MGLVQGVCDACGGKIRRESPVPIIVLCECYRYCPICGSEMEPYTPDLSPRAYRNEDDPLWDPAGAAAKDEASTGTFYVCMNHSPPYYSRRMPVEVLLE